MKHIDLSGAWIFSADPFPAYRCRLDNQHPKDGAFLMVRGVRPVTWCGMAQSQSVLPKNHFRIAKVPRTNTYAISDSEDNTNRCLLFIGQTGEYVALRENQTTGIVVAEHSVRNNHIMRLEVITVLDIGQTVSFQITGNFTLTKIFRWDGVALEHKILVGDQTISGVPA